jgi:hypothetical protein
MLEFVWIWKLCEGEVLMYSFRHFQKLKHDSTIKKNYSVHKKKPRICSLDKLLASTKIIAKVVRLTQMSTLTKLNNLV